MKHKPRRHTIFVRGISFEWLEARTIIVVPKGRHSPRLLITGNQTRATEDTSQAVPSSVQEIVEAAIRFALDHGYTPETNGPPMWVRYDKGTFDLVVHSEPKNDG